jgi:long-chain acyl-CoA synthetase
MLNLGRFVREHATYHPERVAMRLGARQVSYRELDALSDRVAHHLVSLGLKRGDKVALSCPNLPYFPVVYYGILKAGMVVVPLNVLLKGREVAYHLQDAEAKAYFVFEGTPELPMAQFGREGFEATPGCQHLIVMTADPAAPSPIDGATPLREVLAGSAGRFEIAATAPEDTAVILYTSGTTGQAKGAELTHLNMVMNAVVSSALFQRPGDLPHARNFLMVLPLFHSFGQTCGMNAMFYAGAQLTLLPRFDAAQALAAMREHLVTAFAGVPTMYWALLNEARTLPPEHLQRLRDTLTICASGGAAMPVELLKAFEATFGVEIQEGYGLSETSPVASFNHLGRPRKPGSVGQPIFGVEMKVVDADDREVSDGETGEIVIRGHNIMKGYYRRPEATREATRGGWFHSGDIGRRDEDGYFFIVDRVKDMILRGGFNVYPREVEEVLMTHPDVSMVAVVGIPNEEHGEEIRAYVVPKPGSSPDPAAIVAWCKEQMAAYKYPREVVLRESLPMNATGKILKRELRQDAPQPA